MCQCCQLSMLSMNLSLIEIKICTFLKKLLVFLKITTLKGCCYLGAFFFIQCPPMFIQCCSSIYAYSPAHFKKNHMTTKISAGSIKFPPPDCLGKDNAMIGQRKAFYKQRIPESSCARRETSL